MVAKDDFDGNATHLNCFFMRLNFEQKHPKLAIVALEDHFGNRSACCMQYTMTAPKPKRSCFAISNMYTMPL